MGVTISVVGWRIYCQYEASIRERVSPLNKQLWYTTIIVLLQFPSDSNAKVMHLVSVFARAKRAPEQICPHAFVPGIAEEETGVEASDAEGVDRRRLTADLATHRQGVAAVLRRLPQGDARYDYRVLHVFLFLFWTECCCAVPGGGWGCRIRRPH